MSIVTEIETVDDQFCFCLRLGERDVVLFAFRTEKEARIAADALREIAEHAVDILPAADAGNQNAAEAQTTESDDEATAGATAGAGKPATADSPFLGR